MAASEHEVKEQQWGDFPTTFWEMLEESHIEVEAPTLSSPQTEELSKLLWDLKLEKYETTLLELGVTSLDGLKCLSESDIESLGIPLGHKLKLIKKVKELSKAKSPIK